MRTKASKAIIVEIASGLILFLGIMSYSSESLPKYINRLNMLLAAFIFLYYFLKQKFRLSDLILLAGSFGLGMVNLAVVHQQAVQNYLLISGAYFAAALVLIKQERFTLPFWNVLTVGTTALIMLFWFRSEDGYMLFYGTSRNFVSVYLIEMLFVFAYTHYKNGRRVSIFVYILYFLCCIAAVGRMGIIISGMLLATVLAYRLFLREGLSPGKKLLSIAAAFLAIFAIMIFFFRNEEVILERYFSRFVSDNNSSDQARLEIVTAYIEAISSPKAFLMGANTHSISLLESWNSNPHNSFFMIHASFGIVGFLVYLTGILWTLRKLCRNRQHELAIILFAFAIRGLTDTLLCGQPGDILAWFLLLFPFRPQKSAEKMGMRILFMEGNKI